MPQPFAPTSIRRDTNFVDRQTGRLSDHGVMFLEQLWRQVSAGHVVMPVTISGTANALILTPKYGDEGAASYGDHMCWAGVATANSSGSVTATVAKLSTVSLSSLKVYKSAGATQAGVGDIVSGSFYQFFYVSTLDSGAGGLVLK